MLASRASAASQSNAKHICIQTEVSKVSKVSKTKAKTEKELFSSAPVALWLHQPLAADSHVGDGLASFLFLLLKL